MSDIKEFLDRTWIVAMVINIAIMFALIFAAVFIHSEPVSWILLVAAFLPAWLAVDSLSAYLGE